MFKLDKDINGFNVDSTFTHIGRSGVLDDTYKSDWQLLVPKLSVVLSYKNRTVTKEYTLSAMDLKNNVKLKTMFSRTGRKYTGKSVLYISDDWDSKVYIEKGNSRNPLYASNSQSTLLNVSDLIFIYLPTQEDLMYILWALISDMLMIYEYDEDEFAEMFMSECSIQKLRESEVIYNTIKNDIFNLGINEDVLYETMEQLQKKGIE